MNDDKIIGRVINQIVNNDVEALSRVMSMAKPTDIIGFKSEIHLPHPGIGETLPHLQSTAWIVGEKGSGISVKTNLPDLLK